jgi:hypothetical protein
MPTDRYTLPRVSQEAFEAYHAANPDVYRILRDTALHATWKGRKYLRIRRMIEDLRDSPCLVTKGSTFKLDGSFSGYYARLLMSNEPLLRGMFEVRGKR